ncbi:hypothetical protein ACETRX_19420 [Labrys portucalensis]|uniref:DUF2141 domain-containing protein n=1 Tax=Labrys neptuniae TaxID=376174 RepID=A0ABV6ZHY5_9HYPH
MLMQAANPMMKAAIRRGAFLPSAKLRYPGLERWRPLLAKTTLLAIVGACWVQSVCADQPPQRTMICREGGNAMEFVLDGKGTAKLKKTTGLALLLFPDLREEDWTVKVVLEQGVYGLQVANSRGALLSIPSIAAKTIGRMTWNHPENSKVDLLCDINVIR